MFRPDNIGRQNDWRTHTLRTQLAQWHTFSSESIKIATQPDDRRVALDVLDTYLRQVVRRYFLIGCDRQSKECKRVIHLPFQLIQRMTDIQPM